MPGHPVSLVHYNVLCLITQLSIVGPLVSIHHTCQTLHSVCMWLPSKIRFQPLTCICTPTPYPLALTGVQSIWDVCVFVLPPHTRLVSDIIIEHTHTQTKTVAPAPTFPTVVNRLQFTSPYIRKDKNRGSSRFNISQKREIQKLPLLKGVVCFFYLFCTECSICSLSSTENRS